MTVEQTKQNDKDVIIDNQPADPQVVYVPQYNPTTVYTAPPATTTTTTTHGLGHQRPPKRWSAGCSRSAPASLVANAVRR